MGDIFSVLFFGIYSNRLAGFSVVISSTAAMRLHSCFCKILLFSVCNFDFPERPLKFQSTDNPIKIWKCELHTETNYKMEKEECSRIEADSIEFPEEIRDQLLSMPKNYTEKSIPPFSLKYWQTGKIVDVSHPTHISRYQEHFNRISYYNCKSLTQPKMLTYSEKY